MIPHSMLVQVLKDIRLGSALHDNPTEHELATHIISGIYRAMRNEETPKPVLLLAACEVLTGEVVGKEYEIQIRDSGDTKQVVVEWVGDTEDAATADTLADALIEFADAISE